MEIDSPFRLLLTIGCLMVLPITLYYRVRAHAGGEPLDRWQEGAFILFTLRPVALVFVVGVVAYLVNPFWMRSYSVSLPSLLRWVGVALFALGILILIWTLTSLGKNLTDTVVIRKEHYLVTTGPYAWVRHPFYDSVALFIIGSSLTAANWFLLVSGALTFALLAIRIRREEANLLTRFGDTYRSYLDRTGRFLPRIGAK